MTCMCEWKTHHPSMININSRQVCIIEYPLYNKILNQPLISQQWDHALIRCEGWYMASFCWCSGKMPLMRTPTTRRDVTNRPIHRFMVTVWTFSHHHLWPHISSSNDILFSPSDEGRYEVILMTEVAQMIVVSIAMLDKIDWFILSTQWLLIIPIVSLSFFLFSMYFIHTKI